MSAFKVAFRLARRDVRRRKGRTALVALLVALPVAGMTIAVVLLRSEPESRFETWAEFHGAADAVAWGSSDEVTGNPLEPNLDSLPAGSVTTMVRSGYEVFRRPDREGRSQVEVTDFPLGTDLAEGYATLLSGRAPGSVDEIALTTRAASQLNAELGERVTLDRPVTTTVRVVGIVERPACLSCGTVFTTDVAAVTGSSLQSIFGLIELPDSATANEVLATSDPTLGLDFREGRISTTDERATGVRWSLVIGALVLTVVGIVISAAFAVGARRQLVTIGQLSATGASPPVVRGMLVLQGTATGILGAVAGMALGWALLLPNKRLIEGWVDHRLGAWRARPGELLAVLLIGIVAATLAATLPARTAARIPTLRALAGRRPLSPVPHRLTAGGVVAVACGLALLGIAVLGARSGDGSTVWALVAITGGVIELLGACAIAPSLVARLEPLSGRARGSARLAARSLARQRTRSGGVLAAVCAASALAVGSAGLILGATTDDDYPQLPDDVVAISSVEATVFTPPPEKDGGEYVYNTFSPIPPTSELRAEAAAVLPGAAQLPLRDAGGDWSTDTDMYFGSMFDYGKTGPAIATDALLDAFDVPGRARDALERDGIVLLSDRDDVANVTGPDGVPVQADIVDSDTQAMSSLLVTEDFAREHDAPIVETGLLFVLDEPLTTDQRDDLYDLQRGHDGTMAAPTVSVTLAYESSSGPTPFQLELILSGVALVFALFVVGTGLALAAAESKDERDVLTVAGAPPRTLARAAGAKAWLLATLGAGLAIPIGFLPVVVFSWAEADTSTFDLTFPLRTVLLLLAVVPLVAAGASWLASAGAQRVRPVRVSTATFE